MATKKTTLSPEQELSDLEARLAGALKPVSPSRNFMNHLNQRMRFPDRSEIRERVGDWRRLFLALGGVLSGMLLFITVARALYYLVGRK